MALPKFSDNPIYNMNIPSTNQMVKFRPFLVKEQKVLLIALESQDEKQILEAILNCIQSCVQGKLNIKFLTTFDIEYMFLKIRSKSVGEKTDLLIPCVSCDEKCEVKVDLESIEINDIERELELIKINDEYSLKLRYPRYAEVMNKVTSTTEKNLVSQIYILIRTCLDSLMTAEERILFDDETPEEVESFLDSLPGEVFEKIMKFSQSIPALFHDIEYDCQSCNHHNVRSLEGLTDFFQYASPMKR